jgi:enoyl-CoA hydratase/carnithine racemase
MARGARMSSSFLRYEVDRDVAVITMNNPPASWMSLKLLLEIEDAVEGIDAFMSRRRPKFTGS